MDKRCCALKSIEELYFEFDLNATSSFVVSLTPSISASFNSTGRKTWRKIHFMTSIWTGVTSGDSWLIQSRSFAS